MWPLLSKLSPISTSKRISNPLQMDKSLTWKSIFTKWKSQQRWVMASLSNHRLNLKMISISSTWETLENSQRRIKELRLLIVLRSANSPTSTTLTSKFETSLTKVCQSPHRSSWIKRQLGLRKLTGTRCRGKRRSQAAHSSSIVQMWHLATRETRCRGVWLLEMATSTLTQWSTQPC